MKKLLLIILLPLMFCSCATIINSSRQYVPIRSNPPGATVSLNDREFGTTPTSIKMKRINKVHTVKLTLNGYETYETSLDRVVDPWIMGNILLGGLVGLCIDAATGGMYHLTPNIINATLKPTEEKTRK